MDRCVVSSYISFLLGVVLLCGIAAEREVAAQNFSGLQGQELKLVRDRDTVIEGLLDRALKKQSGSIDKVVVVDDAERRLVLSVRYAQLDGKVLWGELTDREKKPQPQIQTNSAVLKGGSNQVELVFKLDERLPREAMLESAVLKLYIAKDLRSSPSTTITYGITKHWQMEIRPENLVVVITPQPIEEAARLLGQPPSTGIPGR